MGTTEFKSSEFENLIQTLATRFAKHSERHEGIAWKKVLERLREAPDKLWSLQRMEDTGGEPDVVAFDPETGEYIFMDCASESPKGRRSLCYDRAALDARKEYKPANSAIDMAEEMGIRVLSEPDYRYLQSLGVFDTKTSSWIQTPDRIRKLGGALFCDFRYDTVFVYHNGAQSYYAARGFRGMLNV